MPNSPRPLWSSGSQPIRKINMIITFVCDVLGEENNGTTIATMNVIRSM